MTTQEHLNSINARLTEAESDFAKLKAEMAAEDAAARMLTERVVEE